MSVTTPQKQNSSGMPRSIFAIFYPRLAFVEPVYRAIMRYMDADNEHRPDCLLRLSATRDLVRESMTNSVSPAARAPMRPK
jgi:hypothetical protein